MPSIELLQGEAAKLAWHQDEPIAGHEFLRRVERYDLVARPG